jgi:hypothetical protein
MEKLRISRVCAVALFVCAVAGQAMAVPTVYNTGVDDGFAQLTPTTPDSHWTLVLPDESSGTAYATDPNPAWVANPSDSMWIGPASSLTTVALGSYVYTQTFTIDDRVWFPSS